MQFLSSPLARHTSSLKALTSQPVMRFVLAGTLFLSLLLLLWSSQSSHSGILGRPHRPPHGGPPESPIHFPGSQHGSGSHIGEPSSSELRNWKKPQGMKIIGLVFYGRRQFVEVLDCYLQRNLVRNGGVMDEVFFVVNTEDEDDLDYLDRIVNGTEGYKKHITEKKHEGWTDKWELAERGNIYIKIDGKLRSRRGMAASKLFRDDISIIQIERECFGCGLLLRLHLYSSSRILMTLTQLSHSNRPEERGFTRSHRFYLDKADVGTQTMSFSSKTMPLHRSQSA